MKCNFDIAKPYLKHLSTQSSIIVLQEHGLFPCQIPKLRSVLNDYDGVGKPSAQLSDSDVGRRYGIGGCGILWRKSLGYKVKRYQNEGSDRICMIELILQHQSIFIICVYMPHQTCAISHFIPELTILKNILDKYRPKGPCIVLGDWNVNIGAAHGMRCSGNPSLYERHLLNLASNYSLTIADIGEKGRGELYTFTGGHGTSYLDHILVPNDMMNMVSFCEVLPDCVENVSDHLAIIMNTRITLNLNQTVENIYNSRIAWDKIQDEEIMNRYTAPLELECEKILLEHGIDPIFLMNLPEYFSLDYQHLEDILYDLVQAIIQQGDTLKRNHFCSFLKPFWTKRLSELTDAKVLTKACWLEKYGRENRENDEFQSYKDSKREFKRQKRIDERNYDRKEMNQLNLTGEIDQKYFWYLVSKFKAKIITPILSEKGDLLTEPAEIQKEWTLYYEKLYNEGEDEHYDDDFKNFVCQKVVDIENEMRHHNSTKYLKGGPITYKDVDGIIKSLPNNKAAGYDKMCSEHLKKAGQLVKSTVTWLVNGMIKFASIPAQLKKGLIVSIPKPNKDSVLKDNNRGLTLLPTLYKVFEKIILLREDEWVQETISPIQSCGKTHLSCIHTSFAVQQSIGLHKNLGKTVYLGSTDGKKAFDTLWIAGLLYKLYLYKLNSKAWLLIQNAYSDFYCTAFVGGITGRWFTPNRGVHQGAPLSMILYTAFNNELLEKLRRNTHGLCIRNQNLSCPTHADDVVILTQQKVGLNSMFKTSVDYSKKWRYMYNNDKTVFMVWGNDSSPHIPIVFNGDVLSPVDESKHMGVILISDDKKSDEVTQKRIGKGKQALYAGLGIGGSNVVTSPTTMSKIYWSVAVPKMMFGIEVTPLSDKDLDTIEVAHRQHANLIQNLPTSTPKPASLALLGWQSMKSYVGYVKIMFMIRVLCLPLTSLHRNLMVMSIEMYQDRDGEERFLTPVGDALRYVKLYGLSDVIQTCIRSGQYSMVIGLKKHVRRVISEYEDIAWRSSCLLYRRLCLYNNIVQQRGTNIWWTFVKYNSGAFKRTSAVMSLLCGSQPKGMGKNFSRNPRCQICDLYASEDFVHTLFVCDCLNVARQRLLGDLTDTMPAGMRTDFLNMNHEEKLIFLLSGLSCNRYLKEWIHIYYKASTFIYEMFRARADEYDRFDDALV